MAQTISSGERPYQTRRRERPKLTPNPKARLRDQVHEVMRFLHFSERTEETYWQWTVRYLKFHRQGQGELKIKNAKLARVAEPGGAAGIKSKITIKTETVSDGWRHPKDLGAAEVA